MIRLSSCMRFRIALLPAMLLLALAVGGLGCRAAGEADGTAEASTDKADDDGKPKADGDQENKEKGSKGKDEEKETPVPVEVIALEHGTIQSTLRATTNLEAEREVMVFSQAARQLIELRVEEGDHVDKGDVLARLMDDEQRSALAKVQSQHEKAVREYERQKSLHEKKLISDEVFNNATYEVDQLRISLEDARRELGYTEVRAPIAGTVTGRHVKVGDQITIGQHLFDLVDFDSIVARIYVPEKELPRLRVGLNARVTTQGVEDRAHAGRVDRISPVVDPQTGTVKVTVAFDRSADLRPGMYVDVNLITDIHPGALLMPKRALVYDQDQIFAYRLGEERRVERVLVQPILEDRNNIEPADGFAPGDQIVVAGQAGLKDNALVRLPGDPDPEDEEEDAPDDEAQIVTAEAE